MHTANTVGSGILHDQKKNIRVEVTVKEFHDYFIWPYAVWEEMQLRYDACAQNKRPHENKKQKKTTDRQSVHQPTQQRPSTAF